jgi:hypothetical protein
MHPVAARAATAVAVFAGIAALALACGTDAVGVEACRQIESARCLQAPNCGIDLSTPVHRNAPTTDIDACVRFYHEQCLHGLATTTEPGAVQVKACVDAINTGDCNVVKAPESSAACAWLIPPAAPAAPTTTDAASTDAAGDDAAAADSGYQCPPSCVDLGTGIPLCLGAHECACAAPISASAQVCQLAGSNTDNSIAYCCQ